MTTCVGALLIRGSTLLLGRRASHKSYAGCWDIVGGHIEPGETPEAALARELVEEIGVTPLARQLLQSCPFREGDSWSELLIYRIDFWRGEPVIANDEHVALCWFSFTEACELESLAAEEYRAVFRNLERNRG